MDFSRVESVEVVDCDDLHGALGGVFVVGDGVQLAPGTSAATVMPYAYPGVAAPCADEACTGENPPKNVTATAQGSWHRGWVVDLVVG